MQKTFFYMTKVIKINSRSNKSDYKYYWMPGSCFEMGVMWWKVYSNSQNLLKDVQCTRCLVLILFFLLSPGT